MQIFSEQVLSAKQSRMGKVEQDLFKSCVTEGFKEEFSFISFENGRDNALITYF